MEVKEVKESPVAQEQVPATESHDHAHGDGHQHFEYEKPADWAEKVPSSMILMAFQAGNPLELVADIQVSAFPGDVGGQLANVNRWRRQVGLGPVAPEALQDFITEMEISGHPAWQVDFTGIDTAQAGGPVRMVVSAVFVDENTWFFKLAGSESAVADELANYKAFLASVKF